jgi:hypothetical protein
VPSNVVATRIILERLIRLLEGQIALWAWTERGEILGGFNGQLAPLHVPRAATRLHHLQRQQQRKLLLRQGPFPAKPQARARGAQRRREPRAASPVRRHRATSAALRAPPEDPSSSQSGDEPPLASGTDRRPPLRTCEVCGQEFRPRRKSTARICKRACVQKAYRDRKRARASAEVIASVSAGREAKDLSERTRSELRDLVARRRLGLPLRKVAT